VTLGECAGGVARDVVLDSARDWINRKSEIRKKAETRIMFSQNCWHNAALD
jgi:hypothetical protein